MLTALVGIVLVPIPTPVLLRGLLHRWAQAVVWGVRWIGGMKVEIRGREYPPDEGPGAARQQASQRESMASCSRP